MKLSKVLVVGAIVMLGLTAWAQDLPKAELAVQYSFLRFNPSVYNSQSHNLNGGGMGLTFNVYKFLGFTAELNGYGASTSTFNIPAPVVRPSGTIPAGTFTTSGNMYTYLFGPQFKTHTGKVDLFGEALFGGATSNAFFNLYKATGQVGAAPGNNGFAMAFGGGLDVPVTSHISIRPARLDYVLTRLTNFLAQSNQTNWRYQAGVVFALGGTTGKNK